MGKSNAECGHHDEQDGQQRGHEKYASTDGHKVILPSLVSFPGALLISNQLGARFIPTFFCRLPKIHARCLHVSCTFRAALGRNLRTQTVETGTWNGIK